MAGSMLMLDAAGRRRSPVTTPGYLARRAPRNKGMQYPPDPPRPEEIIQVMRHAGQQRHGVRARALIAVLWRGGLRISEALALNETDVDPRRGSLLIRHGKGDRRREIGMDPFGFEQLAAWTAHRTRLAPGRLFCVIDGATRGRRWSANAARSELRQLARSTPESDAPSRHISYAMPTPSSSREKASRSTSSRASSGRSRLSTHRGREEIQFPGAGVVPDEIEAGGASGDALPVADPPGAVLAA